MVIHDFVVGQVCRLTVNESPDTTWRVILCEPGEERIGVIQLDVPPALPRWQSCAELTVAAEIGRLQYLDAGAFEPRLVTGARQSKAAQQRFAQRKAWVEPLVTPEGLCVLLDPERRSQAFRDRAAACNCSADVLRRLVSRYLAGGLTWAALYPIFDRCGGRGGHRDPGPAKRGCPSTARKTGMADALASELNVDESVREKIEAGAYRFFFKRRSRHQKPPSIKRAYCQTLRHYFADGALTVRADGELGFRLRRPFPTRRQFQYWGIDAQRTPELLARRLGTRAMQLVHRMAIDKPGLKVPGPGAVYQIDSTLVDLHLVSRWAREVRIGRPWLYIVRDWWSTLIVGVAVSLEPPSYETACIAVRNAIRNKVEVCNEHGVKIQPEDWPAEGVPAALVADRAELLGMQSDRLALHLSMDLSNLPPYRPDWKGLSEGTFHVINTEGIAYSPGAVVPDHQGRRHMADTPALTLPECTRLLIRLILSYNRRIVEREDRDRGFDELDVGPVTRNEAWDWGIEHRFRPSATPSAADLQWKVAPSGRATITTRGISYRGLTYRLEERAAAGSDLWHARKLGRQTPAVDVAADVNDVTRIWILERDGGAAHGCMLTDGDERWAGFSHAEVTFHKEKYAAELQRRTPEQLEEMISKDAALEKMAKHAIQTLDSVIKAGHEVPVIPMRAARAAEQVLASIELRSEDDQAGRPSESDGPATPTLEELYAER